MKDRIYIELDTSKGYPAGSSIFYECLVCGDTVPSMPQNATACKCRNVIIDVDVGRVAVKDVSKLKIFMKQL